MTISLSGDSMTFAFPHVDPAATMSVSFQRTLRVPDDGTHYGLPPGLGTFPVRRVGDLPTDRVPAEWVRRGGIVMPMWQAEACWLDFSVRAHYPFLMKVGCGGINAVTGGPFTPEPDFDAEDYFEVPAQPWLDGFCTDKGAVRQFVAMPLDLGYTVEEQLTGKAEHGGLQIVVIPLKAAVFQAREEARRREEAMPPVCEDGDFGIGCLPAPMGSMGMGAGGSITQSIETPVEPHDNWELDCGSILSVHLANSASWFAITGEQPPTQPPTAADYTRSGMPWFEWYDDSFARSGSSVLAKAKSVFEFGNGRGEQPLPENESFEPPEPVVLGRPPEEALLSE